MRTFGAALPLALAGTAFFAAYLIATATLVTGTPEALRRRASYADEGLPLILVLTIAAAGAGLVAIFALVNAPGPGSAPRLAIAIANVVLGWTTLHTVAAFHYGHRYYTAAGTDDAPADAGGLAFPETKTPHLHDFLYFAFTVGMTAQTSDVTAFFYNTLILALAVNVAAGLAR